MSIQPCHQVTYPPIYPEINPVVQESDMRLISSCVLVNHNSWLLFGVEMHISYIDKALHVGLEA